MIYIYIQREREGNTHLCTYIIISPGSQPRLPGKTGKAGKTMKTTGKIKAKTRKAGNIHKNLRFPRGGSAIK